MPNSSPRAPRPLHVVHLACVAPPEIGGIGQAAYQEVLGLRKRGLEASLVTAEYGGGGEDENNIVKRLPTWLRVGNAALVKGLSPTLKDADIIHLHYPWYGVAERVLWNKPAKPTVVTFHMDASADDWRGSIFDTHRRFMQTRLLRNASKILVSSQDYAQHSSLASQLAELKDKIVELPFGIDTDFFSPPPDSRFTIHDSRFTILFVGGLDRAHHFKGLSVLLTALADLPEQAHLTIIGDGDERASFEKQVHNRNLASRVTFLGRVSREELRNAYQSASVLVFPSTSVAEAFGLVAVEAQACGIPVIASRLPGVRTVVEEGKTGLLVEPGSVSSLVENILRLMRDPELGKRYGLAGRRRALDRYSEMRHFDRLLSIYRDI